MKELIAIILMSTMIIVLTFKTEKTHATHIIASDENVVVELNDFSGFHFSERLGYFVWGANNYEFWSNENEYSKFGIGHDDTAIYEMTDIKKNFNLNTGETIKSITTSSNRTFYITSEERVLLVEIIEVIKLV